MKITFYPDKDNYDLLKDVKRKTKLINTMISVYDSLENLRIDSGFTDYNILEIFQFGISYLKYQSILKKEMEDKKNDNKKIY